MFDRQYFLICAFLVVFFISQYSVHAESVTCTASSVNADANGDGHVTPTDSQIIFDIYLGKITKPDNIWCIDLNNDDSITPKDSNIAFNIYLGKCNSDGVTNSSNVCDSTNCGSSNKCDGLRTGTGDCDTNCVYSPKDCIINGITLVKNEVNDELNDVVTGFVDIDKASILQVNENYIQLDMKLREENVPFYPNQQNYFWYLDTIPEHPGDDFRIILNAVSGSGVKDTWHVWIDSLIEDRGIYHFPATKFGDTFSVIIPLKLLYDPSHIKWRARAEYKTEFDETPSSEYDLNYTKPYPQLYIDSSAAGIIKKEAFFNNLSDGGSINFSVRDSSGNKIPDMIEYFSSYSQRLYKISDNEFMGNGSGLSMIFARVGSCYLLPDPVVIANGNYMLDGQNTAFILSTAKDYDNLTRFTDILSSIEKNLTGFYPHNGQLLIVEETDGNVLASPNTEFPIPVPLYLPYSISFNEVVWFYFTHEYGHHFHGGILKMNQLIRAYNEAIPSEIGYYAMQELNKTREKYDIPWTISQSIERNIQNKHDTFMNDLAKYQQEGCPFWKLNTWGQYEYDPNNVFNGIIIKIEENYGRETTKKFFELFQPAEELLNYSKLMNIQPINADQTHTMFVAAWSVAANSDLRPFFRQYNYPIDDNYFEKVYPVMKKLRCRQLGDVNYNDHIDCTDASLIFDMYLGRIKEDICGDSNNNGQITPGDSQYLFDNYNLTCHYYADLNADEIVDLIDLVKVGLDFGKKSGFDVKSDVDDSGEVDIFDVVFVTSRFT